ncbi:MAG: hypothetical protein ACJ74Z_23195 [Bryobacteraceae bacterium]
MSVFLAALLLPSLFWDKGPETANLLRQAQIDHISTSPEMAASWRAVPGISADIVDPKQLIRVLTPSAIFHAEEASATRSPWVNSNAWRFLRQPTGRFYYEAPGSAAPLAAAEAFMYAANAVIHTDAAGLDPFGKMLAFVKQVGSEDLPPMVNIGFVDDGSRQSGEFMNLLVRRNLLFRVVKKPDPKLDLTVSLGSPQYPMSEADNPNFLAGKVRSNLSDEKRLLRLYGSELVVGRLVGDTNGARLYLLNYGAARSPVEGVRIRILGLYTKQNIAEYDRPNPRLLDVSAGPAATEFTVPELKVFGVINLSRD